LSRFLSGHERVYINDIHTVARNQKHALVNRMSTQTGQYRSGRHEGDRYTQRQEDGRRRRRRRALVYV